MGLSAMALVPTRNRSARFATIGVDARKVVGLFA